MMFDRIVSIQLLQKSFRRKKRRKKTTFSIQNKAQNSLKCSELQALNIKAATRHLPLNQCCRHEQSFEMKNERKSGEEK